MRLGTISSRRRRRGGGFASEHLRRIYTDMHEAHVEEEKEGTDADDNEDDGIILFAGSFSTTFTFFSSSATPSLCSTVVHSGNLGEGRVDVWVGEAPPIGRREGGEGRAACCMRVAWCHKRSTNGLKTAV